MKIVNKNIIAEGRGVKIVRLEIKSPFISDKACPGQFVIIMSNEQGERIPLTIADKNTKKGTITIIFQEIGYSTRMLANMKIGECLYALLGPLGNPARIKNYGRVLVVAGGVGIAEVYPLIKGLNEAGCAISAILGAKTKDMLILRDEIANYCRKVYIATNDGSAGKKGFVTDVLKEIIKDDNFNLIYCVGPVIMMREVAKITKIYEIKTIVSLNSIMLDGTGMCGSCRVKEGNKTKLCCIDGPDFDAHKVDFNELLLRQRRFVEQEKQILEGIACIKQDKNIDL